MEVMEHVAETGPQKQQGIVAALVCLARHKAFLLKTTGLSILGGIIVSFLLPVHYTATVMILTPQQVQSSAPLLLMNPLAGSGLSALVTPTGGSFVLRNPNDIYVGLLESRPIADAIIHKFDLVRVYHSRDMTAARKKLESNTTVASEKSGMLSVTVIDSDKVRSAQIANAYIGQLRLLTKDMAVSEASQRRLYYEEQLSHAKDGLVDAEYAFRQIQQKQGVVQLDAQAKAVIGAQAALRAQIDAKQVELQALRSYSTDVNPSVQMAATQLAALRARAESMQANGGGPSSGGLDLQEVAGAGMDYLRAEHEFLYRQALLDMLFKEYDAAKLDEAKQGAVIQVVAPGIPPDRKSFPQRTLVLLLFMIVGLVCACVYVLIADAAEQHPALLQPWREVAAAIKNR